MAVFNTSIANTSKELRLSFVEIPGQDQTLGIAFEITLQKAEGKETSG